MKIRFMVALVTCFAMLTLPLMAHAQPVLVPSAALAGDDPDGTLSAFGDAFGAGADTWDRWLFVGAPRETAFRDGLDLSDGAVYIYEQVGGSYIFSQKLTRPGNSDPSLPVGDRFGGGIEAANGWLFVGAANDQDFPGLVDPRQGIFDPGDPPFLFAGQVHVYRLVSGIGWEFVQTLTSPVPGTFGSFGTRSQASHIALNSAGRVAVIGELNNFAADEEIGDGIGELHTYHLDEGSWHYVQTIEAPPGITSFGDDLDFASDKYLIVGAGDTSDDGITDQGYVFAYKAKGNSAEFFATPQQALPGPVTLAADCPIAGVGGFGRSGLDASHDVVVVADPCAAGAAGLFAGTLSIYSVGNGRMPLTLQQTVEGDAPDLSLGANAFGSRHAVAVSDGGHRILAGAALSPLGFFDGAAVGADVRVYYYDGGAWTLESTLTTFTPTSAIFRSFGDTVFFTDDETAFIREGNFIDPVITGLKGQGLLYDLTP